MLIIRYHPKALEELREAMLWYEAKDPFLSDDFFKDYQLTAEKIFAAPTMWRKWRRQNRKRNFIKFPYAIIYSLPEENVVYIKGVAHLHRRPGYWEER